LIVPWLALVGFGHWITFRRAVEAGTTAGSRSARAPAEWRRIAEASALAAVWCSLPTYAFAGSSEHSQVVIGGAMGAMIVAAVALLAMPRAALAWIAVVTLSLCTAYFFSSPSLDPKLAAGIIGLASVTIFGIGRLTRWTYDQLRDMAKVRAQSESVRLLLREYEHRGVGWLWQVDSENRVVYISSRMTALLGRSTSQLIGHSLPASLGGNSALGRTLLARQPFANLEMELKTRRGTRWISLAAIRSSTWPARSRASAASAPTSPRSARRRSGSPIWPIWTCCRACPIAAGFASCSARRCPPRSRPMCPARSCSRSGRLQAGQRHVRPPQGRRRAEERCAAAGQEVGDAGHVGRMGGDEFAIVIKDAQGRKTVENLASRLIESVAAPYHIDKVEIASAPRSAALSARSTARASTISSRRPTWPSTRPRMKAAAPAATSTTTCARWPSTACGWSRIFRMRSAPASYGSSTSR
jgi:PAS domain-containing protein